MIFLKSELFFDATLIQQGLRDGKDANVVCDQVT